ncbi:MAG: hypothetical protein ACRBBN_21410, partial [Methyloligellaceae bacterium]
MDSLKYILLVFLLGVLIFLLYMSFSQKSKDISSLNDLVKCVNILECRGSNCKPVPEYCSQITPKKQISEKQMKPQAKPVINKAEVKTEADDAWGLKKLYARINNYFKTESKPAKSKSG